MKSDLKTFNVQQPEVEPRPGIGPDVNLIGGVCRWLFFDMTFGARGSDFGSGAWFYANCANFRELFSDS